ncbi:MAG: YggT family protein [Oscillochloris sp.]|nr:YggT family protein [Oscillochloris sp.]
MSTEREAHGPVQSDNVDHHHSHTNHDAHSDLIHRSGDPTAPAPELSGRIIEEQTTYVDGEVHRTAVERSQVIVRSDEDLAELRWRKTRSTVYFIVHVISIFILIRFALILMGSNPENAFAAFIYGLTEIFLLPFNTLFGPDTEPVYGVPLLEVSALVAIGIYYLFAWIGVQIAKFATRRRFDHRVDRRPIPPTRR